MFYTWHLWKKQRENTEFSSQKPERKYRLEELRVYRNITSKIYLILGCDIQMCKSLNQYINFDNSLNITV